MSDDVLVRVENVSKRFCRSLKRSLWYGLLDLGSEIGGRRHSGGSRLPQISADVQLRTDEFWAVKDVSFELRRGECLGLMGRNGAGKTTLLRMLNGLIKPDTGSIHMRGNVAALIALGAGFNPMLTGRENINVNASIFGIKERELARKMDEIVSFAEIEEFIDSPVQTYSSGMQARLGFAVASALSPDIILLDEVLAVGDVKFRMKCFTKLLSLINNGTTAILVSHNAIDLQRISTRGIFMSKGRSMYDGSTEEALIRYEGSLMEKENLSSLTSTQSSPRVSAYLSLLKNITPITGTPLELILKLSLHSDIEKVRLILHISNHITQLSSISSLVDNDYLKMYAGDSSLLIRVDSLDLIQGAYNVWVDLYGEGIEEYICSSSPIRLNISSNSYDPFGYGVCHIYAPKIHVLTT